ncbi:LacI family DNA-binding transcriptional regulator [Demequina iriomotensis]|uniref:LacI family DNA-binding transcriptional regulator n=1 Tax=Demequina iriomotensis TaxID=1536641 RepID=UPI00078293B5|nr:LacI family DNA-binding transcriptional regulator [Demequina iriomotensis]
MSPSRASMTDVARLAGVSSQTVSRVANGSINVSPDTRQRVLSAMDSVGYTPNTAARALRRGSFETLGVIAHRLARTGESSIVEAVVQAARDSGHTVTLLDIDSTGHEDVAEAASRLSHQAIDGLIIIRAEIEDAGRLALPSGLPAVVADATFGGLLPMVGSDHAGGARLAVEHLLSLCHRTVHHLAGPADSIPARARHQAWRDVLHERGLEAPAVLRGDWTAESGHAAGLELARAGEATAVFCANDEMAAGLMLACAQSGVRIPEDLSVVGFDDIPLAGYLTTPLTTVRQPFARVGRRLVEAVLDRIAGAPATAGTELIPCELVVRGSTAPRP